MLFRSVKANASVECRPFTLTQTELHVELFKLGRFFDWRVGQSVTNPLDPESQGKKIWNKAAYAECKTTKPTFYYSKVWANGFVNGQRWHTDVATSNTKKIACGT